MAGAMTRLSDAVKGLMPLAARRWLVRVRLKVRMLTANERLLPDFVVIGCQRGGTSSLYKYLGRHPEIAPSLRKETEYFTINHHFGETWYRAHFPIEWRRKLARRVGRRLLTFEATPDYLLDPRAPGRCRELLPDAKIIMLLREPGERALSQYHHNVRLGLESEDFAGAIALEPGRIADDVAEIARVPDSKALFFRRFSYVERGRYAMQVDRWLNTYPREQVLILESESFFNDPASVLQRILAFVGARPWLPAEFRNYSYADAAPEAHHSVPEEMRDELDARFSESNQALRELLDVELQWLGPSS